MALACSRIHLPTRRFAVAVPRRRPQPTVVQALYSRVLVFRKSGWVLANLAPSLTLLTIECSGKERGTERPDQTRPDQTRSIAGTCIILYDLNPTHRIGFNSPKDAQLCIGTYYSPTFPLLRSLHRAFPSLADDIIQTRSPQNKRNVKTPTRLGWATNPPSLPPSLPPSFTCPARHSSAHTSQAVAFFPGSCPPYLLALFSSCTCHHSSFAPWAIPLGKKEKEYNTHRTAAIQSQANGPTPLARRCPPLRRLCPIYAPLHTYVHTAATALSYTLLAIHSTQAHVCTYRGDLGPLPKPHARGPPFRLRVYGAALACLHYCSGLCLSSHIKQMRIPSPPLRPQSLGGGVAKEGSRNTPSLGPFPLAGR